MNPEGVASCRARVTTDLAPCSTEIGWFDPLGPDGQRHPTTTTLNGEERRVCDIVQLEGTALDSCRHDYDCTGCTPGWCVTTVDALITHCENGGATLGLRFVGGATETRAGTLHVVFDLTQ
jgi:hypothetical protein